VSEPSLALLVAQSAAKAIGGMAVRASVPAWRAAVAKLIPAPSAVRGSASWASVKLVRAQQHTVERYLASRLCLGLLEILAYLELTSDNGTSVRQLEKAQLGETFRLELAAKLNLPSDKAAQLGRTLWSELHDMVRLQIAELRMTSAFSEAGLVNIAHVVGQRTAHAAESPLAAAITDRVELASQYDRVTNAHAAVRVVGSAMRERYSRLVMPHSREDYRVPIEDIYVTRTLVARSERSLELGRILEAELTDRRFVVLGNPGAGKSTFIRHLLYQTGSPGDELTALAPVVMELKDYAALKDSYLTIMTEQLRAVTQFELDMPAVRDLFILGLALVVFDGLDEIADVEQRRSAVAAIETFSRRYPLVRVVVTSREEGYTTARLDPTQFATYILPDFADVQVSHYVHRWFSLVGTSRLFEADKRANNFLADSEHIADLRTNPLMLSLLCMIYEYEGYIPENRPLVYEECAELLFERWDRVRRVPISFKANSQTRYLVQELAYHFFTNAEAQRGETENRLRQNVQDYFQRNIVGESPAAFRQAQDFLNFCAGRAWLLTQTGHSERGERLFGFTHRTFMEYFAACYIVRHCDSARDVVNMVRPMIQTGASEVVPQIAIQQFDARRADGIDDCLVLLLDPADQSRASLRACLVFALRSLRFMRPTHRTLLQLYSAAVEMYGRSGDTQLLTMLLAAPRDTFELMERSCRKVRAGLPTEVMTNRRVEFGAILVDALLRQIKGGADPAVIAVKLAQDGGNMGAVLGDALPTISATYPNFLHELCAHRLIPAADYIRVAGKQALVSAKSDLYNTKEPGPLIVRLRNFLFTGDADDDLRDLLAQLPTDPTIVLPMQQPIVEALAEISRPVNADVLPGEQSTEPNPTFNRRVLAQQFPLDKAGTPSWSAGFYLLFLGAMAAAYTARRKLHEKAQEGAWRWIANSLPGFSTLFLKRASANRATGELELVQADLADCILDFLPQLQCEDEWKEWFSGWRHETNSPLD
jgi:hypothetical protein